MTQFPKGMEWYFFTVPYTCMLRTRIHTPAISLVAAKKAIVTRYPDDKDLEERLIFEGTVPLSRCTATLDPDGGICFSGVPFP